MNKEPIVIGISCRNRVKYVNTRNHNGVGGTPKDGN